MRTTEWTFGAEHEFADFSLDTTLPKGCAHDRKDWTIVNSNGIANDPKGLLYRFGGEINTPPTDKDDQVDVLTAIKKRVPDVAVNYRSNLHIHIRVPGLKTDLRMLKQVQSYITAHLPTILPILEPIPVPARFQFLTDKEYAGAIRRYKRRVVSHHTFVPQDRVKNQIRAKSCKEFFELEVPSSNERPLYHLQPRACVNLRQMLETDTIEFRHFPGTLVESELSMCLTWCKMFLDHAMHNAGSGDLRNWAIANRQHLPKFASYNHQLENRYRATVHDGTISKDTIRRNIQLILAGRFEEEATSAGIVSR